MPFTLYRVDADFINQRGDVLGPGFISESYLEASTQAIKWVNDRKDLTNIKISTVHFS
jgi:hypothetical protein